MTDRVAFRPYARVAQGSRSRGGLGRGMVSPERILVEPMRGDRLARQEYQDPNVLRHDGKRPYYYIRYRIRVVAGEGKFGRKEIWHPLGYCDEMTKRAALRGGRS